MRGLAPILKANGYIYFNFYAPTPRIALLDVADWLGFGDDSAIAVGYYLDALAAEGPDILRRAR
jgi:hypothetical protein